MAAKTEPEYYEILGVLGESGGREVFLGFSSSSLLHEVSVADVLDEDLGRGYQRRFNKQHSLDFRRYIRSQTATTIPLTFNLRPEENGHWRIIREGAGSALLHLERGYPHAMYQVDCQHRLGFLGDLQIPLAFMAFIGLSATEEMEVFSVINGKAKGLNTSLLDYHDAQLARDLEQERPELFVALQLQEDPASPWHKQLDLGGNTTSGLQRRASLRTLQKAIKRFLQHTLILRNETPRRAYEVTRDFWRAVTVVLESEWNAPRRHFLTKGIGVYSLMSIAGDLYIEARMMPTQIPNETYFIHKLADFANEFDWSNSGPLKGLGGEAGANEAAQMLRQLRKMKALKVVG